MSKYSQDDVDALVAKMNDERGKLLSAVEALSSEAAEFVPANAEGEEQWTAKEQLAHLWEMERSYVAWCNAALAQDGVDLREVRSAPVAIPIEDASQHKIAQLIAALRDERLATIKLVRSLNLEQFSRIGNSPVFGELTVMQWLRSFYRHDRQHGAQIEGRQSEYRPNFQSGREPNQRQARIDQVEARDGS